MNTLLPGFFAILLYLLSSVLLGRRLLRGGRQPQPGKQGAIALGIGGAILHAAALYPLLITAGGVNLGFFNATSCIGLLMAALLMLTALTRPVENLGIVMLPLAALSIVLMFAFPTARTLGNEVTWQIDLHILLSVFAFSILALAALQAVMLAFQDHLLRARRPGGLVQALPPLQIMESLLFQLIATGFILLSASLITGILFLEDIFAQHLVHKTVLSIGAWIVFATLLWGRWRFGWRGPIAIRWTLGGFLFLLLAYLGSKLVLELVLKR